jgi:hypothetical protein
MLMSFERRKVVKMTKAIFIIAFLLVLTCSTGAFAQLSMNQPLDKAAVMSKLALQPLCFTENCGQWDEKILFKAETGGATFWYCRDEVVFQFTRDTDKPTEDTILHGSGKPTGMPDIFNNPRYKKESMVFRARFVGANPNTEIIKENRLSHNNNYFIGNAPSKWTANVPNFSSITYKDIYPGIDLRYHGNGRGMKYDFFVNPGADISQIRIRYDGVDDISISNAGDLQIWTPFGLVYENIPEIYQEVGGRKKEVSGKYILREPGIFGFVVEEYNPSLTLVIDPELVYGTYLGGTNDDYGYDIAVDNFGYAYITGYTASSNFPVQNPYQGDSTGYDAFVAKLSLAGNTLVYSTYLGGNSDDRSYGIAVDSSGCAYITGETWSSDFPTQNPYQWYQEYKDVFVTKLSSAGNALIYSTYLAGNFNDIGYGIAVNDSGCAYVTGATYSTNFPTLNPYQVDQGGWDAFITKLSSSGNMLLYSTYLGGNASDGGFAIAVDASDGAYVTGETASSNFPTQNRFQEYQGESDIFVTKFSSYGNVLIYSTYLGGNSNDYGRGIAVDTSGCAYVTGYTESTNFPTQNPYQGNQTGEDVFVTKLSSYGNALVYSTYLGGNGNDRGGDIAVDASGCAFVTGETWSSDFPTQNPYQGDQGSQDVFVTKFNSFGDTLVYGTYLGGNSYDVGYGIAVDTSGCAYLTGYTESNNFPTQNPYQGFWGIRDVFITKLGPAQSGMIGDYQNNLPKETSLISNYPNPFNMQTKISYFLKYQSNVKIDIFDILGGKIARFSQDNQEPGNHSIIWDASRATSGIYLYRLTAGDYRETKRMLLLK